MAQLGLSAAGAAVSSIFGFGPSAGWLIGSVLGKVLFPTTTKTVNEGPRLGDLQVTASTYGNPIPIGYGTFRIAGNCFWSEPIEEVKNVNTLATSLKGGMSSEQENITYEYYGTFALGLAEGAADAVTRIWADGKLLYDVTGTGAIVRKKGFKFRFYPGNETQLPDSIMEAQEGVGSVPAHRGLCYILVDRMPLKDFGNRRPNITCELTYNPGPVYPGNPYTFESARTTFDGERMVYDTTRKTLVVSNSGTDGLSKISVPSMNEIFYVSDTELRENFPTRTSAVTIKTVDPETGDIFARYGSSNNTPIVKIDGDTLRIVDVFPTGWTESIVFENQPASFAYLDYATTVTILGTDPDDPTVAPSKRTFLLTSSLADDAGILDTEDMSYLWGENQTVDEATIDPPIVGRNVVGEADIYWTASNGSQFSIYKTNVSVTLQVAGTVYFGADDLTLFKRLTVANLNALDGISGITTLSGSRLWVYDPDTDALIGMIKTDADNYILSIDCTTGDVNWNALATGNGGWSGKKGDWYVDMSQTQYYAASYTSQIDLYDKYTGERVIDSLATNSVDTWDTGAWSSGWIYDPDFSAIIGRPSDIADLGILFFGRYGGAGVTLASIVDDLSDRAGLETDEYNTAELTDTVVRGYIISRVTSVRGALEPLMSAYFFDGVESDYQVDFLDRGRASTKSLTQVDLVDVNNGIGGDLDSDVWLQNRAQEQELPMRVTVNYIDIDRDYQSGTQHSKLARDPFPVMYSRNEVSVEYPIVMDGTEAKQIADKALYTSFNERDSYSAMLDWTHIDLNPADVVDVTLDDGSSYKIRFLTIDMGADFSLKFEAVGEETASYSSTALAENNFTPGTIQGGDNSALLKIHNVPLLSDTHDQGRIRGILYFQAGPLISGVDWEGANVYKSSNLVNWEAVGRIINPMVYGKLTNTLGVPTDVFATDNTNTITIFPINGGASLSSITSAEFLEGKLNMAAVGSDANGWEIINFQNVTDNGDGTYTLDTLLRGRRGTDTVAGGHTSLEEFYLLDIDTADAFFIPLSDINTPLYFKAVGDGLAFEEASTITLTPTGEDLKPYAPVNATRTDDSPSAGDITIGWDRRTRINGDLSGGGSNPPLNEDSESYEVDILDGSGGTVLRTLASATESVEYDTANITTDFGSPPTTLYVRIYQLSTQVGRGKSYEFALT